MEVLFERTGKRTYAVEVRRDGGPVMRMDRAPGFDEWFPHDLQHLVVEEQLGLTNGIFGRLADGGTASSFAPAAIGAKADKRAASRRRRRFQRREASLSARGANDFARSERATYIAWQDWLAHSGQARLVAKGVEMAPQASSIMACMAPGERSALLAALPRLRDRVAAVTADWSATPIGRSMTITWSPLPQR